MTTTEILNEGVEAPPPGVRVMAILRWLLVAAMAGAAVWSVGRSVGWFATATHAHVLYQCPMHPQIIRDAPGECPICHMALEPIPERPPAPTGERGDVPGLAPVELTADRIQLTGLRIATVVRKPIGGDLRTIGTVVASEQARAVVSPRAGGWIETLPVSETGRLVKKGQVLATLYSPEVLAAQQELLNARKFGTGPGVPLPADLEASARRRLELLGLTTADIDAVLAAGEPSRTIPIRAPRAGHVIARSAVLGGYVEPGATLFEIADLSTVWLQVEVYEQDAARVHVGQEATLTLPAFPGEIWRGRVTFLQPTLDPGTRTLAVRIELPNRDGKLRPGLYGDVTLAAPAAEALVVPAEAIVDTGDLQYVFIAEERGRFVPRRVQLGARAGDEVAIASGVREGERVVTTANFLLDSESRLRATSW